MVTILFEFMNVSPSRNWSAHLNALKEIIPFITAMDKINYRRVLSVFLSDIWALEKNDPNIEKFFLDGHFSVQVNHILGTAKGVDHASEQENKKLKITVG